jgi:hypothetical protein
MLDGAKVLVMQRIPVRQGSSKTITVEDELHIKKFRRLLPKGPTESGGYRDEPLLQFYAVKGGMRTISKSEVLDIR